MFGVIASVLFYGEVVTERMGAGFVLIFAAILISELAPRRDPSGQQGETCAEGHPDDEDYAVA